jgi:trk system potassium uptake protein TrkA
MIDPDSLARLALFADVGGSELEEVASSFDEQRHARGDRLLREGLSGGSFYVILAGEVSVRIDGEERARLGAGEFFGDLSVLTGEPAAADVVVSSEELRCAVLDAPDFRPLLLRHPPIAIRMLELGARRLRHANEWAS